MRNLVSIGEEVAALAVVQTIAADEADLAVEIWKKLELRPVLQLLQRTRLGRGMEGTVLVCLITPNEHELC